MQDEQAEKAQSAPDGSADRGAGQKDAGRRHYWRRRLIRRAVLLIVVAPVAAILVVALLMIDKEVAAPSWLVERVEARAEQALAGGSLDFGEMTLTVGRDLHPRIVLRNSVLRDRDGIPLARVPRIEGLVSPRGVLKGRLLAQEVVLSGAQLQVRRAADGTVAVAFDSGAGEAGRADTFLGLIDQLDAMFAHGALEALEQVQATGLIINFSDARAGRNWTVDNGRITLDLRDAETVLSANIALLSGRDYVSTAEFTYRSPRGSAEADFGVTITEMAAADIASQSPLLSWLGVLEAPISGALRGVVDENGALTTASATLQIGQGRLQPTAQTRPIPFEGARTYLTYDPADARLGFDLIEVDSDWGALSGAGHAYLREFDAGWPGAILGQVRIGELRINPADLYPEPRDIGAASADFRLRLDPFTLDLGEAVLENGGTPLRLSGRVRAASEGWAVAVDAAAETLDTQSALALWPEAFKPRTRSWFADNLLGGTLSNLTYVHRSSPGQEPRTALNLDFSDASLRALRDLPPIEAAAGTLSEIDRRLVMSLDRGHIVAAQGGRLDLGGSVMTIPRTGPNPPAHFDLSIDGTITAAMSVLSGPPFNALAGSDLPVALADGRGTIKVTLDTILKKDVPREDRSWRAEAALRGVRSEVLIPGRSLSAAALSVQAETDSLTISGGIEVDGLPAQAVYARALGPGSGGTGRITADVPLGPQFLEVFDITLPPGAVTGAGTGQLELDLSQPEGPGFTLTSDLAGVGLSLSSIGWAKAAGETGRFELAGQLGDTPRIDRIALEAAGLSAVGAITLSPDGGLESALFSQLRIGDWFDAPVTLVGRGAGQPAEIRLNGGTLDLRRARFGAGAGEAGPMTIALDRLQVSEGIALTGFRGNFTGAGGLSGTFTGAVNGGTAVQGTLVPIEGRSAVRLRSADAGGVFRDAGLLGNGFGGEMDLTLRPAGAEGTYLGRLQARDLRVRDAPALASLLDAISVVGLLAQMGGQGLLFNDVEADFTLTPDRITVQNASAVGPGLGLSLDGVYGLASRRMDFQGVISPFYALNGIGAILTRPGEGLIGFNFTLQGSVDSPRVLVNPLSALTPGMFREIFRRPPPQPTQ